MKILSASMIRIILGDLNTATEALGTPAGIDVARTYIRFAVKNLLEASVSDVGVEPSRTQEPV